MLNKFPIQESEAEKVWNFIADCIKGAEKLIKKEPTRYRDGIELYLEHLKNAL
jgi:hypothetical protein